MGFNLVYKKAFCLSRWYFFHYAIDLRHVDKRPCFSQMADLSVIITEKGSLLLCCWRHGANLTLEKLMQELRVLNDCGTFLTAVDLVHSNPCPHVRHYTLTRTDIPPLKDQLALHSKCDKLSVHVQRVKTEAVVKCIWIPSHFDTGRRPFIAYKWSKAGMMNWKVCHTLEYDCQVRDNALRRK